MEIEEAKRIINVSSEEIESIKWYLNEGIDINALGNLNYDTYEGIKENLWTISKNIEKGIKNFVNIYTAMYKESKDRKQNRKLVRGTSNKRIMDKQNFTLQFLSCTNMEEIAKRFTEYMDGALVYINISSDVPFLDVKKYRDEDRQNEKETIIAPFCEISSYQELGKYDGYTYYKVELRKSPFEEKTDEELKQLSNEVINDFSEHINNINQLKDIEDRFEYLNEQIKIEDKNLNIFEEKNKVLDEYCQVNRRIDNYCTKLRSLLKGLCKKKELEIDRAYEVIEKYKIEGFRKDLSKEMSSLLASAPTNIATLKNAIEETYKSLLATEENAKELSSFLGVEYKKANSINSCVESIKAIQENIKNIRGKMEGVTITGEESFEDIQKISNDLRMPLYGVDYGAELSKEFAKIANMYKLQIDSEVKRNLYFKVHKSIQSAKITKYLEEKEKINSQEIGIVGRLIGRKQLKDEKLKNINLKISLEKNNIPQVQDSYDIKEMLVDIYSAVIKEFDGKFNPEMYTMYNLIKSSFQENKSNEMSDEYIYELAMKKIQDRQSNLPTVKSDKHKFFGKNKLKLDMLKRENEDLQNKISDKISNNTSKELFSHVESDPIEVFKRDLEGIAANTIVRNKEQVKESSKQSFSIGE